MREKRILIFGLLHENVRIPLGSAATHYHSLSAKQQRSRMRLMIKSFEKAAASGELNRLLETGDHIEGFIRSKTK